MQKTILMIITVSVLMVSFAPFVVGQSVKYISYHYDSSGRLISSDILQARELTRIAHNYDTTIAVQEEIWTAYAQADGLVDNHVLSILEDSKGHFWFGTENGVSRYDGFWTTFLSGFRVSDICQDSKGNIWFATNGGIRKHRPDQGIWESITRENKDYTLPSNNVLSVIADSRGQLWVGTDTGAVIRRPNGDWYNPMIPGSSSSTTEGRNPNPLPVYTLFEDRQRQVWLGTDGGVGYVAEYNEAGLIRSHIFHRFSGENLVITDFDEDNAGTLLFATNVGIGKKVRKGNEQNDPFSISSIADASNGLADDRIQSVLVDRHGHIWYGTADGVSRYDGTKWRTFLSGLSISEVYEDTLGNVWVATKGTGVFKLDNTLRVLSGALGLRDNSISAVLEDRKGNTWVGTYGGGLRKFDGKNWEILTREHGLSSNIVLSLCLDTRNHLWIGTTNGVSRYDRRKFKRFLKGQWIHDILEDRMGALWFATYSRGIVKYNGEDWVTYTDDDIGIQGLNDIDINRKPPELALKLVAKINQDRKYDIMSEGGQRTSNTTPIESIFEDKAGNLWFGTWNGVLKYDGRSWTHFPLISEWKQRLPNDNESEEKPPVPDLTIPYSEIVFSIAEDNQGNLWCGTWDGVLKYDGTTWQKLTEKEGFIGGPVWSIFKDDTGKLWFGTLRGVVKYDGATWSRFNTDERLDNWTLAISQDRQGNMMFGARQGLVVYQPDLTPPKLRIIDGIAENSVVTEKQISFAYESGDLRSTKSELVYSVWPDQNRPFPVTPNPDDESQWSEYTSDTKVSYSELPDGEHTIRIRAKDQDLNVAEASRKFIVDTTPVEARIDEPDSNDRVRSLVSIEGVANDPDNRFKNYTVEYRKDSVQEWTRLKDSPVPTEGGELAKWDVRGLEDEIYHIRLTTQDGRGQKATDSVKVVVDNMSIQTLVDIEVAEVPKYLFSSLIKYNDETHLATAYLSNKHDKSLTASVKLTIPGYIKEETIKSGTSPGISLLPQNPSIEGESQFLPEKVEIKVKLPDKILNTTDSRIHLKPSIQVDYQGISGYRPAKETFTIQLIKPGFVPVADGVPPFAAFIDPEDPIVIQFARQITAEYAQAGLESALPAQLEDAERNLFFDNATQWRPLLNAMQIYETLRHLGLRYVPDSIPYSRRAELQFDEVTYPRNFLTLKKKAGDCDDVSASICALCESVGLRTALVEVPGHVFVLVNTGLYYEPDRIGPLKLPAEKFIRINGTDDSSWDFYYAIPLDASQEKDDTFIEAWESGLKTYHDNKNTREIFIVQKEHEKYPPAYPPGNPSAPQVENFNPIDERIRADLETIVGWQRTHEREQKEKANSIVDLIGIGKVLALNEDIPEARATFQKADAMDEGNRFPAIENNLGNLARLEGKPQEALAMYQKAHELDPDDPGIWLNLAMVSHELMEKDRASKWLWQLKQKVEVDLPYIARLLGIQPEPPKEIQGTQSILESKLHTLLQRVRDADTMADLNLSDVQFSGEELKGAGSGVYWKSAKSRVEEVRE